MDEVLKLAKYLTLEIGAIDAKYDLCSALNHKNPMRGINDGIKVLDIAQMLDQAINDYVSGGKNVLKS